MQVESGESRADSITAPLSAKQVRELVGDMLEELEARGARWSEILNVLADVAQLRGQHELAQILALRYTSGVQARTKV